MVVKKTVQEKRRGQIITVVVARRMKRMGKFHDVDLLVFDCFVNCY